MVNIHETVLAISKSPYYYGSSSDIQDKKTILEMSIEYKYRIPLTYQGRFCNNIPIIHIIGLNN